MHLFKPLYNSFRCTATYFEKPFVPYSLDIAVTSRLSSRHHFYRIRNFITASCLASTKFARLSDSDEIATHLADSKAVSGLRRPAFMLSSTSIFPYPFSCPLRALLFRRGFLQRAFSPTQKITTSIFTYCFVPTLVLAHAFCFLLQTARLQSAYRALLHVFPNFSFCLSA